MKTVILAAGISQRLRPLTNNTPKCLLKVGGKSILQRTIENLLANRLDDLIIVTGYLQEQIIDFMDLNYPQLKTNFIFNNRFAETNNIYSLWMTKNFVLGNDMLLLDSDILFDKKIISLLLKSGYKNCLALRTDHQLSDEEIKVRLKDDKSIAEISKTVDLRYAVGESIGIEKFSTDFNKKLFNILDKKILNENQVNIFYEAAFQDAINEGEKIYAVDIGKLKCIELDFAEDIERAAKEVIQHLN